MTDEVQRILDAALQLDDDERAAIAAVLMDSLGSGDSPETIESAWRVEIERRLAAIRSGTMPMVSSEDAKLQMRAIIDRARSRDDSESHPEQPQRIVG